MQRYLFYRISSRSNDKTRVMGFSKVECLENLIACFPDYRVVCVADHCDAGTISLLKRYGFYRLYETRLGNAGSFRFLINRALQQVSPDDVVYFVEDDYWHTEDARERLEEGLRTFDYVTLYDHPDKYGTFGGDKNPLVPSGQLSEETRVFKGTVCVWRTTNSTTMTFACLAKTMLADRPIWNLAAMGRSVPLDFYAWIVLTRPRISKVNVAFQIRAFGWLSHLRRLIGFRKRYLGVPIDASAAHLLRDLVPDNYVTKFRPGTSTPQHVEGHVGSRP